MTDRLLSPADAAKWLTQHGYAIGEQGVRKQLRSGFLPGKQHAGRWLITESALIQHFGLRDEAPAPSPFVVRRIA